MEKGITDFDCDFFIFIYINSVTPFINPFFNGTTKHDHCSAVYPSMNFVRRKMIRGIYTFIFRITILHIGTETRQFFALFTHTVQFIVAWASFAYNETSYEAFKAS